MNSPNGIDHDPKPGAQKKNGRYVGPRQPKRAGKGRRPRKGAALPVDLEPGPAFEAALKPLFDLVADGIARAMATQGAAVAVQETQTAFDAKGKVEPTATAAAEEPRQRPCGWESCTAVLPPGMPAGLRFHDWSCLQEYLGTLEVEQKRLLKDAGLQTRPRRTPNP